MKIKIMIIKNEVQKKYQVCKHVKIILILNQKTSDDDAFGSEENRPKPKLSPIVIAKSDSMLASANSDDSTYDNDDIKSKSKSVDIRAKPKSSNVRPASARPSTKPKLTESRIVRLREHRAQVDITDRLAIDRQFEVGDEVIFYSKSDLQYIPGKVESTKTVQNETFYQIAKIFKKDESVRYENEEDDPDRYRKVDKPVLIKKDDYYKIMTQGDFEIELAFTILQTLKDKLKATMAKLKKNTII